MTPRAIGSGAKTFQVASTSAFALDSSWPEGWRWCHDERQPEVLPGHLAAEVGADVVHGRPAAMRRMTTPTTFSTTTPATQPPMASSCDVVAWPACTAGGDLLAGHPPMAHAVRTVITP